MAYIYNIDENEYTEKKKEERKENASTINYYKTDTWSMEQSDISYATRGSVQRMRPPFVALLLARCFHWFICSGIISGRSHFWDFVSISW